MTVSASEREESKLDEGSNQIPQSDPDSLSNSGAEYVTASEWLDQGSGSDHRMDLDLGIESEAEE